MPKHIFNTSNNFSRLINIPLIGVDFSHLEAGVSPDSINRIGQKAALKISHKSAKNNGRVCSLKFQLVPLV